MKSLRFIFLTILVVQSYITVTEAKSKSNKASIQPACDANAVTRNCDFFRERSEQAYIQLPDGGILTNPLFDPKKIPNNQNNPSIGNPQSLANDPTQSFNYEKTISNQAEIIDALEDTDLSTRFKIAFASMAANLTLAQPNQSLEIPWPPYDKDAPIKILKKEEVEVYLKENLSDDEYSHLQETMKVQATPLRAQWEAQQQALEKSMADDQKFAEDSKLQVAAYNKKKDRIKELFLYARENVIAVLKKGKRDSALTSEEKALIERVKSIALTDLDSQEVAEATECSGEGKNASYNPVEHNLSICPGMIMASDAALFL